MSARYSAAFFREFAETSRRSAARVVPLLLELVQPASAADVGCGLGLWLAELQRRGVDDVLGIDGTYVDPASLHVPAERFLARDLTQPFELGRRFDLVLCLEVAEHLPAAAAAGFVANLTALGPVIAFSAAIPHQGGTHHVNEQWPEYWAELFAARGYLAVDALRSRLWHDPDVAFYYAQNLLCFVDRERLASYPRLAAAAQQAAPEAPLARVHPALWLAAHDPRQQPLRPLLAALPHALRQAIARRLKLS